MNAETPRAGSHPPALVVGLLGGIGAGKSAVADQLSRRGARVIPADQLGHEALRQPEVRAGVIRRFGEAVLDGSGQIDRRKLAAIVFRDASQRRRLEELVHPYIGRRLAEEVARARAEGARLIVVDAAVLLEAGWNDVCDRLVYVDAPPAVRRERVTLARGWAGQDWEDREAAQMPLTEKHTRADHVLDNSSTLQHLSRQVDDLMHLWGTSPAEVEAGRGKVASPARPPADARRGVYNEGATQP